MAKSETPEIPALPVGCIDAIAWIAWGAQLAEPVPGCIAIMTAGSGASRMLIGMVAYDVELKPLLQRRPQGAPRIEVRSRAISIDWPEAGVDSEAAPKFTVRGAEDDFKFDGLGLSGPDYDEDSADVFGEGTVLTLEGAGDDARAQINFPRHGTKWLALSVAKLTPVP